MRPDWAQAQPNCNTRATGRYGRTSSSLAALQPAAQIAPLRAGPFDVSRYGTDRSTGEAAFDEKLLLLRPHGAPENRVAMRETPEAPYDVTVSLGMGQVGLSEPPIERNRSFLVGQVFGMAEREVEEEL